VVIGCYNGQTAPSYAIPNVARMAAHLVSCGMFVDVMQRVSSRIDANRNHLMARFLLDYPEATHLFILDGDLRHPPEMPEILALRDKPIVSGLYFRRDHQGNHCPVLYRHAGQGEDNRLGHGTFTNDHFQPITPEVLVFLRDGQAPEHDGPYLFLNRDRSPLDASIALVPIHASGFGCLMLRRDAIEQMPQPYLIDEPGLNGDLVFGRNAMREGIEYWADLSVVASHEAEAHWVGMETFRSYCWFIDRNMRQTYPERYDSLPVQIR